MLPASIPPDDGWRLARSAVPPLGAALPADLGQIAARDGAELRKAVRMRAAVWVAQFGDVGSSDVRQMLGLGDAS